MNAVILMTIKGIRVKLFKTNQHRHDDLFLFCSHASSVRDEDGVNQLAFSQAAKNGSLLFLWLVIGEPSEWLDIMQCCTIWLRNWRIVYSLGIYLSHTSPRLSISVPLSLSVLLIHLILTGRILEWKSLCVVCRLFRVQKNDPTWHGVLCNR